MTEYPKGRPLFTANDALKDLSESELSALGPMIAAGVESMRQFQAAHDRVTYQAMVTLQEPETEVSTTAPVPAGQHRKGIIWPYQVPLLAVAMITLGRIG